MDNLFQISERDKLNKRREAGFLIERKKLDT